MTGPSRRILVVEDEMMIAIMIEDMLLDLGQQVAGVCQSLAAALAATEGPDLPFDMAILDVNLAGERSFPVARRLAERGVPSCSPPATARWGWRSRSAAP